MRCASATHCQQNNNRPCPNQQLDKIFDTTKEGSKEILHFDIQDLYQRYKVLNPNPKFLLCTSIYIYCAHHRKPSRQASGATIEFYIAMAKIISRAFQLLMNIKVTVPHIVISPNFFLICFSSPLNDQTQNPKMLLIYQMTKWI